jgi:predicted aminopeptidase
MSLVLRFLNRFRKSFVLSLVLLLTFTWVGCENLRYYKQAVNGQYQILTSKRSIDNVIADKTTPGKLREKLQFVTNVRSFAEHQLNLPARGQYSQYADVHRRFVVWNVYAADEFSLEPKWWKFPIVGKASYRGYFSEQEARAYGERLKKQGYDVYVSGIEAYSTVGWFRDPVLNTFINNTEVDLAETLFHELAHQTAFAKGDTDFNEAFATAVAEEGLRRWMSSPSSTNSYAEYQADLKRKEQFLRLVMDARTQLEQLYEQPVAGKVQLASLSSVSTTETLEDKRQRKQQIIANLRAEHRKLRDTEWAGNPEYDNWFNKPINNAKLNTVATYYELVPAFNKLLGKCDGDLPRFYSEVRRIAKLPKEERRAVLGVVEQPLRAIAGKD